MTRARHEVDATGGESDSAARRSAARPGNQIDSILRLQTMGGNQQVARLLVQRQAKAPTSFPRTGEIRGTWSAALRSKPHKDENDPHRDTLADLPEGTRLAVTGQEKGWLRVTVTIAGKDLTGFVSHELITFVEDGPLVIGDGIVMDTDRMTIEQAFVVLKRAETAKAADPGYRPQGPDADQIDQASWVLNGKWQVDPKTYQVTFQQQGNKKIKLRTIEDFILFVKTIERAYPSASAQEVASEIRQMWFSGSFWEAMLDSRGIKSGGQGVDIEGESNPIARMFDMDDLGATGGKYKQIESALGKVDISHVMSGIDAALSKSPTGSDWKTAAAREANQGDPRDFATWSGDLGQAYANYLVARWVEGEQVGLKEFVDEEAGHDALLGDIHGYIAYEVWKDAPTSNPAQAKEKVSHILRTLYLPDNPAPKPDELVLALPGWSFYRAYTEKITGKPGYLLRDHIVGRSLRFGSAWYGKRVTEDWGMLRQGVAVVLGGSPEEVIREKAMEFDEQHRKNEKTALAEDRLDGLVQSFIDMLDNKVP